MINQELEYRALKILQERPDLTQRQLSKELGVSLGKTHYLLKSLIDVGWVKLDNFQRSGNKWGYAYLLTPKGVVEKASITVRFLNKKKNKSITICSERSRSYNKRSSSKKYLIKSDFLNGNV